MLVGDSLYPPILSDQSSQFINRVQGSSRIHSLGVGITGTGAQRFGCIGSHQSKAQLELSW